MDDLSEKAIRENCPHCDLASLSMSYVLKKTENFVVVCDSHPMMVGHILIIPQAHLSCVGAYPESLMPELVALYDEMGDFLQQTYGKKAAFEHGIVGQTVFHSHIQMFPFDGDPAEIIREGSGKYSALSKIEDLGAVFKENGQYLFFSIGDRSWLADSSLGYPAFFRDRFAEAVGKPQRGQWKKMHMVPELMAEAAIEVGQTQQDWARFNLLKSTVAEEKSVAGRQV